MSNVYIELQYFELEHCWVSNYSISIYKTFERL